VVCGGTHLDIFQQVIGVPLEEDVDSVEAAAQLVLALDHHFPEAGDVWVVEGLALLEGLS